MSCFIISKKYEKTQENKGIYEAEKSGLKKNNFFYILH